MSTLIAILGLGFLILIHEAGHFFVARAVGMRVVERRLEDGQDSVRGRASPTGRIRIGLELTVARLPGL